MIKVENIVLPSPEQWEAVVRGVRNPMNSWDKSDSEMYYETGWECGEFTGVTNEVMEAGIATEGMIYGIGPKDLKLMTNLANAGDDHGKYLRQLFIWADITAPSFWWLQFDTYKVGVTSNSCSKMHRLTEKPFDVSDFYISEDLDIFTKVQVKLGSKYPEDQETFTLNDCFKSIIDLLNHLRYKFLDTNDKRYWFAILELLPESYMQKRTVCISFQALRHMVRGRWDHKLPIWRQVLEALLEPIPYAKELIVGELKNAN